MQSKVKLSPSIKAGNLRPCVKTHGGKWYNRQWLLDHLPAGFEDMGYIEAFAGGASLLLNKPKSKSELLNDLDTDLISIWSVIKHRCQEFIDVLETKTYTEETFFEAQETIVCDQLSSDPQEEMDKAVKEYVLRRMSRGGMKKAFAWSKRLRGGKPGDVNAWETMLGMLPAIHRRLQGVEIRNGNAVDLIPGPGISNLCIYLDPPYMKSTRSKGAINIYDHEMSDKEHEAMLAKCLASGAKIMISGYQSTLYSNRLKDWNFKYKPVANHSSQSDRKSIKLECIWMNY